MQLREACKKYKGWSLYRLADEMGDTVKQQAVYSWAIGRTFPREQHLKRICEVLGCTSTDILGF